MKWGALLSAALALLGGCRGTDWLLHGGVDGAIDRANAHADAADGPAVGDGGPADGNDGPADGDGGPACPGCLYISRRMSPKPPLTPTSLQGQTTLPAGADSRGLTS